MRHHSNSIKQQCLIEDILRRHQTPLYYEEPSFTYRPRFSKYKNFYTKKPYLELHQVTPTQKHAKEILQQICYIKKKVIQEARPESSFQRRRDFSADNQVSARGFVYPQKRQIRIKSTQVPTQQTDQDWLAFVLE